MKRNTIIAILIAFCFTASLFMIIPIRSANQPYNPWIDYNDDGQINLQDLVSLANSYGTTGDPTKNVNVTNFPVESATSHMTAILSINATNQNYINVDINQVYIGGRNITVIGCDLTGGVAWFGYNSSQTSGFAPPTGAATFYDTNGTVVGQFALPMTHKINLSNVNMIKLLVQGIAADVSRSNSWSSYYGTAIATLYWIQQ